MPQVQRRYGPLPPVRPNNEVVTEFLDKAKEEAKLEEIRNGRKMRTATEEQYIQDLPRKELTESDKEALQDKEMRMREIRREKRPFTEKEDRDNWELQKLRLTTEGLAAFEEADTRFQVSKMGRPLNEEEERKLKECKDYRAIRARGTSDIT